MSEPQVRQISRYSTVGIQRVCTTPPSLIKSFVIELDHGGCRARIPPPIITTAQLTTGPPWRSTSALETYTTQAKLISGGSTPVG